MITLTERDRKRYWSKVQIGGLDECWRWNGTFNQKGYGAFSTYHNKRKSGCNAHKAGLIFRLGPLPDGIHALHSCIGHPWCQNPCHVYAGTNQDNIDEKMSQGRHRGARGERSPNHKLTAENVIEIRHDYERCGVKDMRYFAGKFGVGWRAIEKVVNRRNWKHI